MVYSINPHRSAVGVYSGMFEPADREAYYRNMITAGMAQCAALIDPPSEEAARGWQGKIGLMFIDSDHRYEAVRRDIVAWGRPHLISGGVVVFDDAIDPGGGPPTVFTQVIFRRKILINQ